MATLDTVNALICPRRALCRAGGRGLIREGECLFKILSQTKTELITLCLWSLKCSYELLRMLVEDGLVVPGTYSATCKSKTVIDVFNSDLELDKKKQKLRGWKY